MRDFELSKPKLLTIEEAESLSIDDIWNHYRKYVSQSQVSLIGTFGFGRERVIRSEGCYIFTASGKKILDLTGGIGVLNHGHNHPRILAARKKFNEMHRMEVHKNFFSPYVAALSHNLAQLFPGDLNLSYFPNSGAEAVEGAIKMAYKYHNGNRSTVLHSDISFHGKLLGAASITGSPELNFKFPSITGTAQFIYGDLESTESQIKTIVNEKGESDVYALVIEPLNASSMRSCTPDYLSALRKLCDCEDIVLIFDEVYTGWAKTGHLFNFMRVPGLIPDIVTYAKSFGGGKASISGYTAREKIYRRAYDNLRDATLHSTTYYGFGEETATAIEAVNIIIDDDYVLKSREIEQSFSAGINGFRQKKSTILDEVRGSGALWGFIVKDTFAQKAMQTIAKLLPSEFLKDPRFANKLVISTIINRLYEHHNILTFYGSNIDNPLIISFPLTATTDEVHKAVAALDECFDTSLLKLISEFVQMKLSAPKTLRK